MIALIASFLTLGATGMNIQSPYESVSYKVPNGWKEVEEQGSKILIPEKLKPNQALIVLMLPPENSTSESHEKQFGAKVAKITEGAKVHYKGEIESSNVTGGKVFAQAFVLEDEELGRNLRVIAVVFGSSQRMSLVVVADPPELIEQFEGDITKLLDSIQFKSSSDKPNAGGQSNRDPNAGKAPTGDTPGLFPGMPDWRPSGRGVPIPKTEILDGKPQGLWYLVSYMSSVPKATIYAFMPNGVFSTNPVWGGGNLVDVELQRRTSPAGVGTYSVSGAVLSLQSTGFEARRAAFSHGSDETGLFFKHGESVFRELKLPTTSALVGRWRSVGTQYIFNSNGTFEIGQVASGDNWVSGSNSSGRFLIDGVLVVLEYQGRTVIVPIGIVSSRQLLIGSTLFVRS
jgi:hypothetical protein